MCYVLYGGAPCALVVPLDVTGGTGRKHESSLIIREKVTSRSRSSYPGHRRWDLRPLLIMNRVIWQQSDAKVSGIVSG